MSSYSYSQLNTNSQIRLEEPSNFLARNWFQLFLLGLGAYILFSKDISVQFNLNSAGSYANVEQLTIMPDYSNPREPGANVIPTAYSSKSNSPKKKKKKWKNNRANNFSNLTLIFSPSYAKRKNIPDEVVEEKMQTLRNYIKQYKRIAKAEMEQFGIPASITLAQGLLESNAGESRLALESNNHFGIKCRRKCRGCTCRNYSDDDIYDMFRVFDSPANSYREHSELLISKRYKHLLKLKKTDYKKWARGLKKAGYATDKRYAEKLVKIIETLKLYKYDK